uniref:Ataxin-10 n=1 Tax=Syphacia muris TaxID=451379 RepID=A0A0N5ANM1_9BILA
MDPDLSIQSLFVRGSSLSRNKLSLLRRYCATEAKSSAFLDSIDKEDLENFLQRVLDVAVGRDVSNESDVEKLKFQKLALRTLVNAVNRSVMLRSFLNQKTLHTLRVILKQQVLQVEVCALLNTIFCHNLTELQSTDEYALLLGDLINLWAEEKSWISSILSICFEKSLSFLSYCYERLDLSTFTNLLYSVSVLADKSDDQKAINLSISDARFCVELLKEFERICENMLSCGDLEHNGKKCLVPMYAMMYLLEIISLLALERPDYNAVFHPCIDGIRYVVWILEAIIDNEISHEIQSFKPSNAPDRPSKEPLKRRDVANNSFISKLSMYLCFMNAHDIGLLKRNCMEALQNLCCESLQNQVIAGDFDAISLVLSCARRLDSNCPSQIQRAIAVLRFLCIGCQENQARLARINNAAPAIIDTKRLFLEMGIESIIDPASNTVKLKKAT